MIEGRCFRIYENSGFRKRNKFDEDGCVSLGAYIREKFVDGRFEASGWVDTSEWFKIEKPSELNQIEKKQTYLGEEHDRQSLYDTIEECLENGEELIIAEGKSREAQIVIDYLKYLELERQIRNLQQQCVELSKEEDNLNQEIISLKQKLTGLINKRTVLQEQLKDLQESQDELLR